MGQALPPTRKEVEGITTLSLGRSAARHSAAAVHHLLGLGRIGIGAVLAAALLRPLFTNPKGDER